MDLLIGFKDRPPKTMSQSCQTFKIDITKILIEDRAWFSQVRICANTNVPTELL
jgi:hypothetical protein